MYPYGGLDRDLGCVLFGLFNHLAQLLLNQQFEEQEAAGGKNEIHRNLGPRPNAPPFIRIKYSMQVKSVQTVLEVSKVVVGRVPRPAGLLRG